MPEHFLKTIYDFSKHNAIKIKLPKNQIPKILYCQQEYAAVHNLQNLAHREVEGKIKSQNIAFTYMNQAKQKQKKKFYCIFLKQYSMISFFFLFLQEDFAL